MNIFLLEDDILLKDGISHYLKLIGHTVHSERNGNIAKEILKKTNFDLLILDINVPDLDGLSLLEELHNNQIIIPTIYISAIIDIEDITKAFNLGCCDYLKKPFHLNELQLRINNIIKTRQLNSVHKRLSKSYSFDLNTRSLLFNGEAQTLNRRQLQVIELLAKNRGNVVYFDMFRDYIWENELISDSTIRSEIYRLKKNLKENFIKTIRNIGYLIERPN